MKGDIHKNGRNISKRMRKGASRLRKIVSKKALKQKKWNERRKQGKGHSYADRNATLKTLGFATYRDYLASQLWASIRARGFALHGNKCRLCNASADVLHHVGYGKAVLTGTNLKPLIPLCEGCHTQVEFKPNGEKRKLSSAGGAYIKLLCLKKQREQAAIRGIALEDKTIRVHELQSESDVPPRDFALSPIDVFSSLGIISNG